MCDDADDDNKDGSQDYHKYHAAAEMAAGRT